MTAFSFGTAIAIPRSTTQYQEVVMETVKYLNEKQLSEFTGLAVQTLRNWRHLGRGFPYSKVGRAGRYSVTDVQEYMESRKVRMKA